MKFINLIFLILFSFAAYAQPQWNGAFKKKTIYIDNRSSNGTIGDAWQTVDESSSFAINQTTSGRDLTLPNPTDTTAGDDVTVRNIGTVSFKMYNVNVLPDSLDIHLTWKDSRWRVVSGGGGSGCCDSLRFYKNDVEANNTGLNTGDYYLNAKSNDYGMAWGVVKMISESFPFDGSLPPGCIANAPAEQLNFFTNDDDAKTSGLSVGEYYLMDKNNSYAMAYGTIKQITE